MRDDQNVHYIKIYILLFIVIVGNLIGILLYIYILMLYEYRRWKYFYDADYNGFIGGGGYVNHFAMSRLQNLREEFLTALSTYNNILLKFPYFTEGKILHQINFLILFFSIFFVIIIITLIISNISLTFTNENLEWNTRHLHGGGSRALGGILNIFK